MEIHHLPKTPGIYCIVNASSGKRYIGSSVNLFKRAKEHRSALDRGMHGNQHLQRAWIAARDAFSIQVVEACEVERIIEREQFHIDALRVFDA